MEIKIINIFFPIFILAYIGISMLLSLVVSITGVQLPLWLLYLLNDVILLLIVIVYMAIEKIGLIRDIPYRKIRPVDALLSIIAGYALIPMMLFISNVSMLFSTNYFEQSAIEIMTLPFIVRILLIAAAPAIVEELIFRGVFFGAYKQGGVLKAILMSGLVFGLFHLNLNQFCYATIMGFVFALLIEATGTIWSSVLAHFAVNTYSVIMMQLMSTAQSGAAGDLIDNASNTSLTDYPVTVIIIQLVILMMVALGFMFIAYLCIKKMAVRNQRYEYIRSLKFKSGVRTATVPFLVTALACVIYMILIEL